MAAGSIPPSGVRRKTARREPGGLSNLLRAALQPIEDLVGPEALEPVQRLVQSCELVRVDPADLFDGAHMLLIEGAHGLAHVGPLFSELDANRTAIDARALVIEEAHLDELLQIVRDVRAEIVAARAQFARGQFLV